MQHLEGSGTPVLYIGRTVLKGYGMLERWNRQWDRCINAEENIW